MGKALYRKYRSKSLDEVVGQEHVTTTLANALRKGSVSHAYLLTGPRGVGKTSIARILAHEVNKLPYSEDSTEHLDIIEIDAASNNGVEHVRELREKAFITPANAPYKVYIIDEVHMLSKPAFNALLKILEEPPSHVIFILATTEVHKLPETIVSRTQRFTFKPVEKHQVINHLRGIAKSEGIEIADDALELVAAHGGGSFRDSISLLDQVGNTSVTVSLSDVQRTLGIAPADALQRLMDAIDSGSTKDIVETLAGLREQGYQSAQIAKQLAAFYREQLIAGTHSIDAGVAARALKLFLEVPVSHAPDTSLEVALIEIALHLDTPQAPPAPKQPTKKDTVVASTQKSTPLKSGMPSSPANETKNQLGVVPKMEEQAPLATDIVVPETESSAEKELQAFDAAIWNQVLDAIKSHHNTLYSVARMAVPTIDGDTLTLGFKFPFHMKKINDAKPKQLIAQVVQELTGRTIVVSCIVQKDAVAPQHAVTPPQSSPPPADPSIANISNIFGGAEVIES